MRSTRHADLPAATATRMRTVPLLRLLHARTPLLLLLHCIVLVKLLQWRVQGDRDSATEPASVERIVEVVCYCKSLKLESRYFERHADKLHWLGIEEDTTPSNRAAVVLLSLGIPVKLSVQQDQDKVHRSIVYNCIHCQYFDEIAKKKKISGAGIEPAIFCV